MEFRLCFLPIWGTQVFVLKNLKVGFMSEDNTLWLLELEVLCSKVLERNIPWVHASTPENPWLLQTGGKLMVLWTLREALLRDTTPPALEVWNLASSHLQSVKNSTIVSANWCCEAKIKEMKITENKAGNSWFAYVWIICYSFEILKVLIIYQWLNDRWSWH